MRQAIFIMMSIFTLSCKVTDEGCYNFNYDYEISSYHDKVSRKNFSYTDFFKNDTLIVTIGREGDCTRYYYNKNGYLTESIWGRNCCFGRRNILIYDSANNHIGNYITLDTVINFEKLKFNRDFFYDKNGKLIKECVNGWTGQDGGHNETWNYYSYKANRIDSSITITNKDTVWKAGYCYDKNGNLIQIYKTRKDVYEIENYKYNKKGQKIEEQKISTANPITPTTSFSAGNNKRIYLYDSTGFLKFELIYNHKDELELKVIYIKTIKKTPHNTAYKP